MKLLASFIIAISLVIGVIGATTAYLVPVSYLERLTLAEAQPEGLAINAPAGIDPEDPDEETSLAKPGDEITLELIAALQAQNVHRVNVNRFLFWAWLRGGGLPLFLVGAIGLLGGAVLLRKANRAMLERAGTAPGGARTAAAQMDPRIPLDAIQAGIQKLREDLPRLSDREKMLLIMDIFGEAQRTHVPAFVATRAQLISRLGLGGYAQLMDSFAAAERQLNRAWSAAADGVLDEALERVETAGHLMDEASGKLGSKAD